MKCRLTRRKVVQVYRVEMASCWFIRSGSCPWLADAPAPTPRFSVGVFQATLQQLAGLFIQHRDLLVARV
jgi:hypothetical protein